MEVRVTFARAALNPCCQATLIVPRLHPAPLGCAYKTAEAPGAARRARGDCGAEEKHRLQAQGAGQGVGRAEEAWRGEPGGDGAGTLRSLHARASNVRGLAVGNRQYFTSLSNIRLILPQTHMKQQAPAPAPQASNPEVTVAWRGRGARGRGRGGRGAARGRYVQSAETGASSPGRVTWRLTARRPTLTGDAGAARPQQCYASRASNPRKRKSSRRTLPYVGWRPLFWEEHFRPCK